MVGPPLIDGTFVSRPNRFIVRAALDDGAEIDAHLGDPGRLVELLVPGAALRLRPAAAESRRKTRFSVALVRAARRSGVWVSVAPSMANDLAAELLIRGAIRGLGSGWEIRREVTHGGSRFDFRLAKGKRTVWLEVKSVTLVEDGVALFPDAPTSRGRRHVLELRRLSRAGHEAGVLFVVQREDARVVMPHRGIDPDFTLALFAAREAGVFLRACRFRLGSDGRAVYCGPLPVKVPDAPRT